MSDLKDREIIYTFDTWEDYDDLMQYLEDGGVVWGSEEKPTEFKRLKYMDSNANEVIVTLARGILHYGELWNLKYSPYKDYEKIHWEKRKQKDNEIIYTVDTWKDYDDLMKHLEDSDDTKDILVSLAIGSKDLPSRDYEAIHLKKRPSTSAEIVGCEEEIEKMINLKDRKIIYTFDSWEDYDDLMEYLEDEGVTWVGGKTPTEWYESKAIYHDASQIGIRLAGGTLTYGSKDWYRDHSPYYTESEKIHWKKRKDITLAEFLGWEEDVKYRRNGDIYKVEGNHLKMLKNGTQCKNVYVQTWQLVDLRNAIKYEPKVMIKTPFSSSKGTQYLSKERESGRVFVAALLNSADVIQEFTKDEADKLVCVYKLGGLVEIVEV